MTAIIRRELLTLVRSPLAIASQAGIAVVCALLVLSRWPASGAVDVGGARAIQVLQVLGFGMLAAVVLMTPAAPALSIVRERIGGTLALLLNSPLSPMAIYAGKLGAALGFTGLLLLMAAPAAAALFALGGSSTPGGVGLLFAVLAIASVQLTTLGLLVSSMARSIDSALRTTYALVLALTLLPLAPYWLLQGTDGATAAAWARCISPVPAAMEALGQGGVGTHGLGSSGSTPPRYLLIAAAMSLACAAATIWRLMGVPLDRARPSGVMTQDRSTAGRIGRRMFFLIDPQSRSRGIPPLVNPVMAKEFRSRRLGRSHWTLRLIALTAVFSLGMSYLAANGALGWGVESVGGALVILQATLLLLFAPSLAAGLFSAERESGSWVLLLATPLSAGSILRGKLLSVAWPLELLLCGTLPGYVVLMMVKPELAGQVQRVIGCLVATAVTTALLSATASSLFRRTAAATTAAYLAAIAVCVLPMVVWLGRDEPFGHNAVQAVLQISPIATALSASEMPGFAGYELLPANWWLMAGLSLGLILFLWLRIGRLCRPE